MNTIETRSVGKLILNEYTPTRIPRVEHYVIPSYQRGYRWTDLHVEALLKDIDFFMSKIRKSDESYCLQPIAVVAQKDSDGNRTWEIVDGQQRLITLYIILKCLEKRRKYEIFFQKRKHSTDFLMNLCPENYDHSTPDNHFMSEAHKVITKWFVDKELSDIDYGDRFALVMMDSVKVIWYEMELKGQTAQEIEAEKIDLFNRLNIGKIPLEDAELVRALLMSKFCEGTQHELLLRQAEFSNEWHEIEQFLQKSEVWGFLTKKVYANHIQLIFELLAGNRNSLNYSTYKWFEKTVLDSDNPAVKAQELWKDTKEIYAHFRYWITDRTIYHYAGFLLSSNLIRLDELYRKSQKPKKKFKSSLYDEIKNYLSSVKFSELRYDEKPEEIKKVLLLFNVLTCEELIDSPQNRFPYNLYNDIKETKRWSLEHIHAQHSEDPLFRDDIIKKWIEDTLQSLKNIECIIKGKAPDTKENVIVDLTQLKVKLADFNNQDKIDKDDFNNVRAEIVKAFESDSKHWLDNMALLSSSDNAALNNAIFPVKRDKIIELEKKGHFIPPCTRNVFLKLYSKADNQPYFWSSSDKEAYLDAIEELFETFNKLSL